MGTTGNSKIRQKEFQESEKQDLVEGGFVRDLDEYSFPEASRRYSKATGVLPCGNPGRKFCFALLRYSRLGIHWEGKCRRELEQSLQCLVTGYSESRWRCSYLLLHEGKR